MKIAQIANIAESVPPQKYGGSERIIHTLTEELVSRGHEVTLFASGDSHTSAKLVSVYPQSLRAAKVKDIYGANDYTVLNIIKAFQRQSDFDILHDHTGTYGLMAGTTATTPMVHTMHGPITITNRPIFESVAKHINLVAISESQVKPVPEMPIAGVVYNGLNMENYPFSDTDQGYLLFVGRISHEKGVHFAVEVAQYLNMQLIIAAKLESNHKPDVEYFKQYIEPRIDGERIKWVGEVDETERNKLMSKARCILHPTSWREPFGLTLIEAMACGCPVVAFGRGSIRELVSQGKTGFVVEDTEEMVEAVKNIQVINRSDCRRHALDNFNHQRMTDGYEQIYQRIISNQKKATNVATGSAVI